jgi:hypothetical protein
MEKGTRVSKKLYLSQPGFLRVSNAAFSSDVTHFQTFVATLTAANYKFPLERRQVDFVYLAQI